MLEGLAILDGNDTSVLEALVDQFLMNTVHLDEHFQPETFLTLIEAACTLLESHTCHDEKLLQILCQHVLKQIALHACELSDTHVSRLQGVLQTPKFARFIDKTSPVYDILLTMKASKIGTSEREVMYLNTCLTDELSYNNLLRMLKSN
jgi:hypothetical protein